MYRSLLVPLDGSQFAEATLPLATRLAEGGGTIHLVHAAEPPVTIGLSEFEAQNAGEAAQRMGEYLTQVGQRLAPVPTATYVRSGGVGAVVADYASSEGVDLVVVSTHGRSGMGRAWLGSGSEAIILATTTPVLVHHPAGDDPAPAVGHPAQILVAVDRSDFSLRILPAAEQLAGVLGATLVLATVVEPVVVHARVIGNPVLDVDDAATQERIEEADSFLMDVEATLKARGLSVETRVLTDEQPARAIMAEAEKMGAAAIAMTTHGRKAVARMLFGSVTDKVVRGSRRDVLVLRGERSG
jgi:nucleotide-binding universal stress UspA family protein